LKPAVNVEAETIQLALGIGAGLGVVITMQFKINRCVGRLEGLLTAHLNQTKE